MELTFKEELRSLLNRHCKENDSNTPDYLLAEYLIGCLEIYNKTLVARDKWFGGKHPSESVMFNDEPINIEVDE